MEAIFHSFLKAFGWSIIHSFWQGALIYAVLFLVLISLPKLSPVVKHNLSYGSVSGIFAWFVATFIQQWQIPETFSSLTYIPVEPGVLIRATATWNAANIEMLFPAITALYLVGLLIQAIILYKGYLVLQDFRKTVLKPVPADWAPIFHTVMARLAIKKPAVFHLSGLANVPMVIGYFKPVILFPVSLVTTLDTDQVEAILIHELAHTRRNDYLLNLIKTFMDTVLFFNPFVWLAGRFIKIERENVCDDMVLKYTAQPVKYAETLLQIELLKGLPSPASAMRAVGKKQYLLERIKRITTMKTSYRNVKPQLAGIFLVIFALAGLAWFIPSQNLKREEVKNAVNFSGASTSLNSLPTTLSGLLAGDTLILPKKKSEVKIMVTDPEGNSKEYPSINAIPDSVQKDLGIYPHGDLAFFGDSLLFNSREITKVLDDTFKDSGFLKKYLDLAKVFQSPEFKKQQEGIIKQFSSPEFKQKQAELFEKLNSPEFKKQQEEILKKFSSPEFTQKQAEMIKKFNSPEFQKKQQELMGKQKELIEKFNSPEFKMQQEEMMKKFNSPEFRQQQQELMEKQKNLLEKFNSPRFKNQQDSLHQQHDSLRQSMYERMERIKSSINSSQA